MDGDNQDNVVSMSGHKAVGLIRVKRNLFDDREASKRAKDEASNSLVYNKKSMDIYVKPTSVESELNSSSRCSSPMLVENDQEFENIVCSPTLIQYHYTPDKTVSSQPSAASEENAADMEEYEDDEDDDLYIEEGNVCTNDTLFNMITQNFEHCESFSNNSDDSELRRKLMISSVGSLNHQYKGNDQSNIDNQCGDQSSEMKAAIGGLYLRNPRGKKIVYYRSDILIMNSQEIKSDSTTSTLFIARFKMLRTVIVFTEPHRLTGLWKPITKLHQSYFFNIPQHPKKDSKKLDEAHAHQVSVPHAKAIKAGSRAQEEFSSHRSRKPQDHNECN